ncbi:MAG: flavodoxin family protein [Lachnospiraceae bacterium]
MNIVIINGSPRKKGATSSILHMIEEKLLLYNDVNIEYVDLCDLDIKSCSGCCSCYKTGKCYIEDDAEGLSHKIASADGLILGSPTYASNVSGLLKNFIDRGHFVIEQVLHDKYAISVATGENYGSNDTSKILNKLLQYSGAYLSGKVVYNIPFNSKVADVKLNKKIVTLSKKYYLDIKNKRNHPVQAIIHNFIFKVGIKSFVKRKGDKYQGVIEKWKDMDILI